MRLSARTIRSLLLGGIGIPVLFLSFLYSDNTMVGFSEFNFLSGTDEVNTLSIITTGGDTTNFSVIITNKEPTSMTYKLWFVDAGITNDSFAQRTCLSPNENQNVGQYISGDITPFVLTAGSTGTKNLSVTFPNSHSWAYHWCVTISPVTVNGSTDMNTLSTRWVFLDAQVTPLTSNFPIMVRPAFRPGSLWNNTWYSIVGADVWIFVYENGGWTWLYNSVKNIWNPKITTDKYGAGIVSFIPPASWTLYMMALKGSWTLSLGFTGIWNNDIASFNFFSWTLANSLDSEFMFKYPEWWVTGNYLKVGDIIADTTWNYDFIKDPDFTLMTNNLSTSSNPLHPYRFDLDLNSVINALEETMLLDSYNRIGFIASQSLININQFVNF